MANGGIVMENVYFFTGFPGFIATALLKQIIRDGHTIEHCYLLVLPEMKIKAEEEANKIAAAEKIDKNRLTVITGDITKPGLDLQADVQATVSQQVTHVFHLAAIYDLAVPEKLAYDVNVTGTKNVNEWLFTLLRLKRYIYFSTAYVSGRREGVIYESELVKNQTFKNHYESTKYEAEMLVQQIWNQIPTTIIRPAVVKGDSRTGETIKFDGPYFIMNFFDRLKFMPILPYLGAGGAQGNFVPVDYIIRASTYLGHAEVGAGKIYHLTDPKPYLVHEIYSMLYEAISGRQPKGKIPLSWAKAALAIPQVRRWLGVEKEAMDYFTCMSVYDCSAAQRDLAGSGITCPDFREGIQSMVTFYQANKHDKSKHLKIQ